MYCKTRVEIHSELQCTECMHLVIADVRLNRMSGEYSSALPS